MGFPYRKGVERLLCGSSQETPEAGSYRSWSFLQPGRKEVVREQEVRVKKVNRQKETL
jgi:hypothetical protein